MVHHHRYKTRKIKQEQYDLLFGQIPKDYATRLDWMYDKLHLNSVKCDSIINDYNTLKNKLHFKRIQIVLYEKPEGTPRPRFTRINKKNFSNAAMRDPNYIHVYSPGASDDNKYMRRLVTESDFMDIDNLIYTPCIVTYKTFFKTPSSFNAVDTYLAELGVHTPISKPDWDNIGKKYCDMTSQNIWIDDRLVVSGTVEKWYSILPRVEITIDYLNMLTHISQVKSIQKTFDGDIRFYKDGRGEV